MRVFTFIKNIILVIWQLPQYLLGLFILAYHKFVCKHKGLTSCKIDNIKVYFAKHVNNCGVSLGPFILLDSDVSSAYIKDTNTVHHEHGHQIQSLILGPLYLIIIGIPSGIGNLIFRIPAVYRKYNYYKQPWEAWADKLGKVNR